MPRMLRKTSEKTGATISIHTINVDNRVNEAVNRFKSECRQRKKEKAVNAKIAQVGRNPDGSDP